MMTDSSQGAVISDLDPLVITSPVIRSGTTLLQRVLCSSRRTLIYGELCAQDLDFFLSLYTFKSMQYKQRAGSNAQALQKVLAGEVNEWIADLMPDIDQYVTALGQAAFAGVAYCRDYAHRAGRPIWGFKHPAWKPSTIRILRSVMPKSRFVFIYRDIEDCLRSAKAGLAVNSHQEAAEFCQNWKENLSCMLRLEDDPAVLLLRFEDLLTEPVEVLDRLAAFTGVDDLDPDVLRHKVNAASGEDYLAQAKDGYVSPAELDAAERQFVQLADDEVRAQLDAYQQRTKPCLTT
ncbi:MAG: sulfotransferase [Betaproteobacteria bacterium]